MDLRPLFLGRYAKNPKNFQFQLGEKVLLKKIIQFIQDVENGGHKTFHMNGCLEKSCYQKVTKTEIGIMFCPYTAKIEENIELFKKSKQKMSIFSTKRKPTKQRNKKSNPNPQSDAEMLDDLDQSKDIEATHLRLNRKQMHFVYNLLTFKLNVRCRKFLAKKDYTNDYSTCVNFFDADDEVINNEAEFFQVDKLNSDNSEYKIKGFYATIVCDCGTSSKCTYFFKQRASLHLCPELINALNAVLKNCDLAVESEKLDGLVSGYWHLSNFERHFSSHDKKSKTATNDFNIDLLLNKNVNEDNNERDKETGSTNPAGDVLDKQGDNVELLLHNEEPENHNENCNEKEVTLPADNVSDNENSMEDLMQHQHYKNRNVLCISSDESIFDTTNNEVDMSFNVTGNSFDLNNSLESSNSSTLNGTDLSGEFGEIGQRHTSHITAGSVNRGLTSSGLTMLKEYGVNPNIETSIPLSLKLLRFLKFSKLFLILC